MRLYSEEWVAAFNEAVAGLEPEPDVSFRMLQMVHGGPEGTVHVALSVEGGRVRLQREVAGSPAGPAPRPAAQVTVSVRFEDALALAQGELEPAALLAAGRVKVRGDLSVLVRGQALLAAAAARLGPLSQGTTS
ncbi:MAG: SCP2 sterol-binding domain-containing protein [Actinomycetota bacterium]|nr:SCP2 sterol-binding domain-containing protein [Actinomycetota bacterium]